MRLQPALTEHLYTPGCLLKALQAVPQRSLAAVLKSTLYCAQFSDEETEAPRHHLSIQEQWNARSWDLSLCCALKWSTTKFSEQWGQHCLPQWSCLVRIHVLGPPNFETRTEHLVKLLTK